MTRKVNIKFTHSKDMKILIFFPWCDITSLIEYYRWYVKFQLRYLVGIQYFLFKTRINAKIVKTTLSSNGTLN